MSKPASVDLVAYVRTHVSYELESIAASLKVAYRHGADKPERRCGVEAFLIHTRNLDEFFASKRDEDEVRAADVLPEWPYAEEGSHVVEVPADRGLISAMVTHMGKAREVHAGKDWDLPGIARRIVAVTQRWSAGLGPEYSAAVSAVEARCQEIEGELRWSSTFHALVTGTND